MEHLWRRKGQIWPTYPDSCLGLIQSDQVCFWSSKTLEDECILISHALKCRNHSLRCPFHITSTSIIWTYQSKSYYNSHHHTWMYRLEDLVERVVKMIIENFKLCNSTSYCPSLMYQIDFWMTSGTAPFWKELDSSTRFKAKFWVAIIWHFIHFR